MLELSEVPTDYSSVVILLSLGAFQALFFIRHKFFTEIFGRGFCPESRLTFRSVFRQTATMEAEIDCRLQSNSR